MSASWSDIVAAASGPGDVQKVRSLRWRVFRLYLMFTYYYVPIRDCFTPLKLEHGDRRAVAL